MAGTRSRARRIEEVQIVTSVGTFRMKLQPQPSAAGRYAGTVTANRFGQVGLPLDFEIVTDPDRRRSRRVRRTSTLVIPVTAG